MKSREPQNLGDKPIVVIIGLIASCIGMLVFLTGKQSILDFFKSPQINNSTQVNGHLETASPRPSESLPTNSATYQQEPTVVQTTEVSNLPIATDIPGTPFMLGSSLTSILDKDTRPRDVFSFSLSAGQTLSITLKSSHVTFAQIYKPGTLTVVNTNPEYLCYQDLDCTNTFPVATTGTYYIMISARDSGVKYTLSANIQETLQQPELANDIPGIPFALGNTITSILDRDTRPQDVFSLSLNTGQTLIITLKSSKITDAQLYKPGTVTVTNASNDYLCYQRRDCTTTFDIAATGTYYLRISVYDSGVKYTLSIRIAGT